MISIAGRPEFQVPMTLDQVNVLISLARHHHEHVCKIAARPPDGFLVKARERLIFSMDMDMDMNVSMTWLQLDTCISILDVTLDLNRAERVLAEEMRVNYVGALHLAQDASRTWKAQFQTVSLQNASDSVL